LKLLKITDESTVFQTFIFRRIMEPVFKHAKLSQIIWDDWYWFHYNTSS